MALQGSRSGFVVGGLSLLGFLAGAFVGTRVGPLLLPGGNASPYAPLFGLFGAVLAGSVLAGGLEGVKGSGSRCGAGWRSPASSRPTRRWAPR
ncbi:MAG: hypothetical protein E6G41_15140 [Actinobacteria bacterium]|nr:MAG: hypothetical protein E6G41_15140 [Actinomycetota bacterium]